MSTEITEKISRLLALAASPYEAEARAALLKARQLMAEHKLCPEDITPPERQRVIKESTGVTSTKMSSPWAVQLSAIIGEHYCCRHYTQIHAVSGRIGSMIWTPDAGGSRSRRMPTGWDRSTTSSRCRKRTGPPALCSQISDSGRQTSRPALPAATCCSTTGRHIRNDAQLKWERTICLMASQPSNSFIRQLIAENALFLLPSARLPFTERYGHHGATLFSTIARNDSVQPVRGTGLPVPGLVSKEPA